MRPSLLPGLLAAAQRNHDRGADSIRLFEIGRRYLAEDEHVTLSLVLAGDAAPRDWRTGKARPFDIFDAKARSEEHTSELQSLMRISYAVFCLKQKKYQ